MTTSRRRTFGEVLRNQRVAAGLSHAELAQRSQISVRRLRAMERDVESARNRDAITQPAKALELEPPERAAFEEAALRPPGASRTSRGARDGQGTDPLLAAKLTIPARRSELAYRPRLTDRLQSALSARLI